MYYGVSSNNKLKARNKERITSKTASPSLAAAQMN